MSTSNTPDQTNYDQAIELIGLVCDLLDELRNNGQEDSADYYERQLDAIRVKLVSRLVQQTTHP